MTILIIDNLNAIVNFRSKGDEVMRTRDKVIFGLMLFYLLYVIACGTDIKIVGMIALVFLAAYFKISRHL